MCCMLYQISEERSDVAKRVEAAWQLLSLRLPRSLDSWTTCHQVWEHLTIYAQLRGVQSAQAELLEIVGNCGNH